MVFPGALTMEAPGRLPPVIFYWIWPIHIRNCFHANIFEARRFFVWKMHILMVVDEAPKPAPPHFQLYSLSEHQCLEYSCLVCIAAMQCEPSWPSSKGLKGFSRGWPSHLAALRPGEFQSLNYRFYPKYCLWWFIFNTGNKTHPWRSLFSPCQLIPLNTNDLP